MDLFRAQLNDANVKEDIDDVVVVGG